MLCLGVSVPIAVCAEQRQGLTSCVPPLQGALVQVQAAEAVPARKEQLPTREQQLLALQSGEFDVLVIGGGATGCGCALDAATRGEGWASPAGSRGAWMEQNSLRGFSEVPRGRGLVILAGNLCSQEDPEEGHVAVLFYEKSFP